MKDKVVVTENPFGMFTEKSVGASIVLTRSCLTCQHQYIYIYIYNLFYTHTHVLHFYSTQYFARGMLPSIISFAPRRGL